MVAQQVDSRAHQAYPFDPSCFRFHHSFQHYQYETPGKGRWDNHRRGKTIYLLRSEGKVDLLATAAAAAAGFDRSIQVCLSRSRWSRIGQQCWILKDLLRIE